MKKEQAIRLIETTFENEYDKERFTNFIRNLLKEFEPKNQKINFLLFLRQNIASYIESFEILGRYKDPNGKVIDILSVQLKDENSLIRARTALREAVKEYIEREIIDAALVAFTSSTKDEWKFSLVKIEPRIVETDKKVKIKKEPSPAKRFSYLLGKGEPSYTAKSRFIPLLADEEKFVSLQDLTDAFSVEKVTEEFFEAYRFALYEKVMKEIKAPIRLTDQQKFAFSQKLLSRIMFIYFLQRKGWLKWKDYVQDKRYIKNLWEKYKKYGQNKDTFYSVWLSSLFFGAFNKKSEYINSNLPDEIKESFNNMPFLNGGLFYKDKEDELGIIVPDKVFEWLFEPDFSENDKKKGFLEIFNFTISEDLPIDKEVAVDPEMLGKVYESLVTEEERGSSGIFYTPRTEIDYMCRLSLIEYLHDRTRIDKEKIIDLVFNPHEIRNTGISKEEAEHIEKELSKVSIVDPAVGSGSFLVGMMNILVELRNSLNEIIKGEIENTFELKKKIVQKNLYGVDVKGWAVQVAELRLWLSLIIDADEKELRIYDSPLLPNLSFKVLQGDSLVQEIAGYQINLRQQFQVLPETVKEKIDNLKKMKSDFFAKRSADLKEKEMIIEKEKEIFEELLKSRIRLLEERKTYLEGKQSALKIKHLPASQLNLVAEEETFFTNNEGTLNGQKKELEKIETEIKNVSKELEELKNVLGKFKSENKKNFFLWEVDFAEVFENGGFDIVIGNPPYVRQEDIAPPLEDISKYSEDEKRNLKTTYKTKLAKSLEVHWDGIKISGRSDLYIYFYFHGLSLLKNDGIFCFINSNSWLDDDYGAKLQEFLLKHMQPIFIIDNLKERSFDADINTVITLIKKPIQVPDDYTIKFIAFKKPFEYVANTITTKSINQSNSPVFDREDFRLYPKTKRKLLLEGSEIPEDNDNLSFINDTERLRYVGNKWGAKYLRAPEIYFKILEKGKDKLVPLKEVAEVRFGLKTGVNEFFYLTEEEIKRRGIEKEFWMHQDEKGNWVPNYVIKSPRECKSIIINPEDLKYIVLMIHKDKKDLKGTNVLKYIEEGEQQGFHKRATCANRERWYELPEFKDNIVCMMTVNKRHIWLDNRKQFFIDARLYGAKVKDDRFNEILGITLNSTLFWLFTELQGRENLGEGALDVKVYEYADMPVLKFDNRLEELSKNEICKRPIRDVFDELGASSPEEVSLDKVKPDRRELDKIVMDDILGLSEEEQLEVYRAVLELVKNRLEKAESKKSKKK